jgi:hypothetical protein
MSFLPWNPSSNTTTVVPKYYRILEVALVLFLTAYTRICRKQVITIIKVLEYCYNKGQEFHFGFPIHAAVGFVISKLTI